MTPILHPTAVPVDVSPVAPPPPPERSLLDIFEMTVSACGGRVAVAAGEETLTYRQLSRAVRGIAGRLRAAGIGPGDRVGVRMPSGTAELYVGILGVLTAGAAYVPVDADDPEARAASIWERARACAVIEGELAIRHLAAGCGGGRELTLDDDAWVIFTSGSTGAPKGVAITHRSAAAFVDAEARLWRIEEHDRVLAGLSVGFDASCEEMWLAWRNGAALVAAPRAVVRSGADLGPWLASRGVTVISTVPTLAAMWDEEVIANVRLLILGGEACAPDVGWRLSMGREVWNTYGPTEATVVTTAARIRPLEPITIGRPLDGWQVAVVDADGAAVPYGEIGELAIGGVGLGRYIDPALDGERFAGLEALGGQRAYRTGDMVRETPAGLDFVGRCDDQVKIGGRRVELGEIEAALRAVPGIRAAAAVVRKAASGNPVLVGYVAGDVDPAGVRADIAEHLPAGIVPLVVVIPAMPMSSSGKLDRSALPWPAPSPPATGVSLSGTAAWLAERWTEQLGPVPIAPGSDFFELGGTSLAAAKLVSVLRLRFASVAIADLYQHPRLQDLAARLDQLAPASQATEATEAAHAARWGVLGLVRTLLLVGFTGWGGVLAILTLNNFQHGRFGPQVPWAPLIGAWLVFASAPGRALVVTAVRRALLGRVKPGRYPRHGWLAWRLTFVDGLAEAAHLKSLAGTPWAARIARLAGARIGTDVRLHTLPPPAGLIRIDDGATLERGVDLHGWWFDGHELIIDEVHVGAGASVGARSMLMPGADIGEGAEIEPGSVVSTRVPAGERWAGSPAQRVGRAGAAWPLEPAPRARHRRLWGAMYGVGLSALALIPLIALIPEVAVFAAFAGGVHTTAAAALLAIALAPLEAALFIVSFSALSAVAFRAASSLIRPGWQAADGATAWAHWFTDAQLTMAIGFIFPVYASLFTRPWLRLLGIPVGRRTEVSTAAGLNRFVTLGATSFVTDDVLFAGSRERGGWLHFGPTAVGSRSFVGNGAIVRESTGIGDDCLVGLLSISPPAAPHGTSWFGAPALQLPRVPEPTDAARTTDPPRRLIAGRVATELVRILLPTSVGVALGAGGFIVTEKVGQLGGVGAMIAAAPFIVLAAGILALLFTVAMKWLVMGRYCSGEHPLWSFFVWRDEIMNSLQTQLCAFVLAPALGTALMSAYLRGMGAKVGKDVWCGTMNITEFDMVTFGDGCVINRNACVETHLFHDRLLRIGPTRLERGSTLGPGSAVLPDTVLGAGSSVGGRSVVMRGEELPPGTCWHGAPVRRR